MVGMKKKRIVIGNWKMNPPTLADAKKIFSKIKQLSAEVSGVLVVCPPATYLNALVSSYKGKKIMFGAQDAHWLNNGSMTGFLSPTMAQSAGAKYLIVGHSERRALAGETPEIIAKKVLAGVEAQLTVILCIGEKVRDRNAEYLTVIREDLRECLKKIDKRMMAHMMIAYEPVWAIGGRDAMSPSDIHGMTIYIRKVLTELYDKQISDATQILYGGAVNVDNVADIVKDGEIDGLLVGRDSLIPENIMQIVAVANGK
ncbi:TPA: triose-phosphate isomerase [Candidatus Taylorbacteria bacterium]|nr:triose-phosphate isomerase [Candidatus Taylorbacteria bacterium]